MTQIRIVTVGEPFIGDPEMLSVAVDILTLMDSMGLLQGEDEIARLDDETLLALSRAAGRAGLAPQAVAQLELPDGRRRDRAIRQLREALQNSPLPRYEWESMASALGIEKLARLVGVAEGSLRRYMAGKRATPDDVAARLHFLARVVGYLRGGYNDVGVRRWFERQRQVLGGASPESLLSGRWSPEDEPAGAVLELAHSLTGSPAT
jgi:hypothetical protein